MRKKVMASYHDEPTKGHLGVHKTTELVKQRYWWKGMDKDIEKYVKSYMVCQVRKFDHMKKRLDPSNLFQFPPGNENKSPQIW